MPLGSFRLWNRNTSCYIFFLLWAKDAVKLDLGLAASTALWLTDQVQNGDLVPTPLSMASPVCPRKSLASSELLYFQFSLEINVSLTKAGVFVLAWRNMSCLSFLLKGQRRSLYSGFLIVFLFYSVSNKAPQTRWLKTEISSLRDRYQSVTRASPLSEVLGENPSLALQLLVAPVLVWWQHDFRLCLGLHTAFSSLCPSVSPFPCKGTGGWIRGHP